MHNSSNIIEGNTQQAFYQTGYVNIENQPVTNSPFLYASVADKNQPYGYEESDLKNIYMTREALQSRMVSPVITQEQMLMQRMNNNQ
jgi:hypothetical protein